MNNKIFEVQDKTGRKIRLPKDRWNHIRIEHPEIIEPEEIEQALKMSQNASTTKNSADVENKKRLFESILKRRQALDFLISLS